MKGTYILMAIAAALLFAIGDSFWKYRFHGHFEIQFKNLIKFWLLPDKILVAMVFTFLLGGIAKLITLYPLREVELSSFLPVVIVFAILFVSISGILIFKDDLTARKFFGILAALVAVYFLK